MYATWKWMIAGTAFVAAFALAPADPVGAQQAPDSVQIDSIANLYEGVQFDHTMHADLAGSCAVCHHHGTGEVQDPNCSRCHSNSEKKPIVACRDCHAADSFSAENVRQKEKDVLLYHRDKPGLKGAYHQNCMGCHQEMGGPIDCQDCHVRNDAGDAFFNAGKYAPKGNGAGPVHH